MPHNDAGSIAGDALRRLQKLEQYMSQHGNSISELVKAHSSLDDRVKRLEELAQSRAITEAREDERDKALYGRLDRMEAEIKGIKGIGSKALWVFIAAIITAVSTFVLRGGLV